jgi:hypothetical protein
MCRERPRCRSAKKSDELAPLHVPAEESLYLQL